MSDVKRVLVTGGRGFLGRTLCGLSVPGIQTIPTAREGEAGWPDLDITVADSVERAVASEKPDWVINTAAATHVDGCEDDPDGTRLIHVEATRYLAESCARHGAGLVHISTNYVFDGTSGPYSETDPTNPINVYGRTKLEGEACVLDPSVKGLVARTAVLYGYQPKSGPNFVTWAIGALRRGEAIRIVTDEWTNPTEIGELAGFLLAACREELTGLYHVAGADFLSRYEMVMTICEVFGFDKELVTPLTSADFAQKAPRPLGTGLRIDKARATGHYDVRPYRDHMAGLRDRLPA